MIIKVAILIILTITLLVCFYIRFNIKTPHTKISFKESLDLTDLPIITFYIKDKKCNFLLDTGANLSVINNKVLSSITHEKTSITGNVYGLEGNRQSVEYVNVVLTYKDKDYPETVQALDMSAAFANIKKESGVTLHGILGNQFFQKYKYVIDFNELVAYSKLDNK